MNTGVNAVFRKRLSEFLEMSLPVVCQIKITVTWKCSVQQPDHCEA